MKRKQPTQRSLVFVLAMMLVVCAWLSAFAFTLWKLREDALANGIRTAEIHARNFEEHLTQILQTIDLTASTLDLRDGPFDRYGIQTRFDDILRPTPSLRDLALLDRGGRIIAGFSPSGVGRNVDVDDFFPSNQHDSDMLRIGPPWRGRDFSDGVPATDLSSLQRQEAFFLPVLRRLSSESGAMWLLVALNPDYFINHALQLVPPEEGHVQWMRYDGVALASSHPLDRPSDGLATLAVSARLPKSEQGAFVETLPDGRTLLTAFRTSRRFPVVVAVHLDKQVILSGWADQSRRLGAVVVPVLIALLVAASLFWIRRQRHEARRLAASVFESSSDSIIITTPAGYIVSVNPSFERLTGYASEELVGRELCSLAHDQDECVRLRDIWRHFLTNRHWQGELRCLCKDARTITVSLTLDLVHDVTGKPAHCAGLMSDITERKAIEEKLQLAASVFSHSREGILITALDGRIIDVNAAFTDITGYTRDEVVGRNPRLLQSGVHDHAFYETMWSSLVHNGYWDGEIWNRRKSGEVFVEMLTISLVREANGKPLRYVALFSDISTMKEHQRKLELRAHYDALTSLPNRLMLADRLRQSMANALRRNTLFALVFIDLDGFKAINDEYGHATGDKLLVALSVRMQEALRAGDTLARLGGDEFVALLIDLAGHHDSEPVLDRLGEAAAQPILIDGHTVQVSASIGVTFFPQQGMTDADQLLSQADEAMYRAKMLGKNCRQVFDVAQM